MGKKLYLTNGVSYGGKYTVVSDDVAVAAVPEVITLTVTAGCTSDASLGVVLRGASSVPVAVTTAASTPSAVATLIQAETYTGWVATVDGAVVTFTATVAGEKTGSNTFDASTSGVTATFEVNTVGTDTVDGSVTFDFSSTYALGNPVDYDMVVSIMVLNSSNVFIPLTDAVITYPVVGQMTIADGSTFKLTAGYILNIVASRSRTI